MINLVKELKSRYPSRIILFDLPPLLAAADALAFSPYVDAALLVIEEGKTQAQDVKRALELLQTTNVIGSVLNKSGVIKNDNDGGHNGYLNNLRQVPNYLKSGILSLRNRMSRMRNKGN